LFDMTWSRPISLWLAPALLLALGVVAILSGALGLQTALGNRLFDAYQRHAPRPFTDGAIAVRVLDLPATDEDSLVRITRTLVAQKVRVIAFTAPLDAGPSPQSLAAKLPPGSDAARAALGQLPEPGHDLAAEIAPAKAVVPVLLGTAGRAPSIKARFVYRGTRDPFGAVPRFDSAAAAPAILENNAAGSAAATPLPDADGVVRTAPLALRAAGTLVPGMAAEILRIAHGQSDIP
jgi:adenylate cyclase